MAEVCFARGEGMEGTGLAGPGSGRQDAIQDGNLTGQRVRYLCSSGGIPCALAAISPGPRCRGQGRVSADPVLWGASCA